MSGIKLEIEADNSDFLKSIDEAEIKSKGFTKVIEQLGGNFDKIIEGDIPKNLKQIGLTSKNLGDDFLSAKAAAGKFADHLTSKLAEAREANQKILDEINSWTDVKASVKIDFLNEYTQKESELKAIEEGVNNFKNAVDSLEPTFESLRQKLTAVKNEMLNLASTGQKDTKRYDELSKKAEEYENSIKELNVELKALGGNAGLNLLVESLGLASSGMAVFQGLSALSGNENERLEQIMVKLQATMSVAIGVQQLQNSLTKESGILQSVMRVQTLARAKAEELAAASTGRATIAQRAFNLVAKANPYVLLATALITVVGAYAIFSSKTQKAAKDQEAINKATADGAAENIVKYKQLQVQWNSLANDFKAKKKFIEENKDKFNELGVEVSNVNDAEKFLHDKSNDFLEAMILRAKALAFSQLAAEKYKKSIAASLEIEGNKSEYEKTTKVNNDPNQSGVYKFFRGLFYKDKIAEKIENDKAGEALLDSEQKFWEEYNSKMSSFKLYAGKAKMERKPKTSKEKSEEFLPEGSVAEIQKRLSEIDKALSKSNNDKLTETLKVKRIATAKELAEAEKKIQIQSLMDQFDESDKLWVQYYEAVQVLGENKAKDIYSDLLKNDASQYDELIRKQTELKDKAKIGLLSEEELEILLVYTARIDELTGNLSSIEIFKKNLDDELDQYKTVSEKIKVIQDKIGKTSGIDADKAYLAELQTRLFSLQDQWKEYYKSILDEQKSYEEKSAELTREYNSVKESKDYAKASPEDKKKIDKSFTQRQGNLDMDFIQKSKEWEFAFSELEGMSSISLDRILSKLLEFQQKSKGTLSLQDAAKLQEAIDKVRNASSNNPFQKLVTSFQQYKEALKAAKSAQLDYNSAQKNYDQAIEEYGNSSEQAKAALENLNKAGNKTLDADKKQLEAKKKLISTLQQSQDVFNAIGNGVVEIADAFGGMSDASKDAVEDIMAIGNAALDLAKSIASGDVAGMIKAGIQLIGSLAKALNGDKKKERDIKKQAAVVKELEKAYNDLAFAAEKAFGAQKYSSQTEMIRNLEQQKIKLQQMIIQEGSKKKSDQGKIDEWNNQIQSINQSIYNIKENIIKDVLQTDVVDAAAKVGDALVDAFGRGEDAAKSLEIAANDMVKNLLKNQLNLMLQNRMKPILDNLLKAAGFNQDGSGSFTGLTPQQIADFKAQVQAAGLDMQGFLNAYSDIFSGLNINTTSLEGAVKGVTQETAGIIAGQMNAMRTMQAEALTLNKGNQEIFRNQLLQLAQIEVNTRYLKGIYEGIQAMRDNYGFRGIGKM